MDHLSSTTDADSDPDPLAALHTAEERRMQDALFGAAAAGIPPVPDGEMWRLIQQLREARELAPFRIWLVGSRTEPGHERSDIDLVFSAKPTLAPDDLQIDDALRHCREFGLYSATPACLFDPCFRIGGPKGPSAGAELALPPDEPVRTVKLFSPNLMRQILARRIRAYRRIGRCSIEFVRDAGDSSYYRKLPKKTFDGELSAYLRPAVEI